MQYCNSVGVGWDSCRENLKWGLKRPSKCTAAKPIARQGPIVLYELTYSNSNTMLVANEKYF